MKSLVVRRSAKEETKTFAFLPSRFLAQSLTSLGHVQSSINKHILGLFWTKIQQPMQVYIFAACSRLILLKEITFNRNNALSQSFAENPSSCEWNGGT